MARKSLKEMATTGGGPVRRVEKNGTVVLRFLYPMSDEEQGWSYLCTTFDEESRRSEYYEPEDAPKGAREIFFAVAFEVGGSEQAEVWELKKSLVKALSGYDDEYGSISDRDYKIRRRGEQLNTEYSAMPMDKAAPTDEMKAARKESSGLLREILNDLLSVSDDSTSTKDSKQESAEESAEEVDTGDWEDE